MTICLLVSRGILLNLGITQNFSFDCELPYTVYLVTAAIVLIISALPFPFLVGSYVVTIVKKKFSLNGRLKIQIKSQ